MVKIMGVSLEKQNSGWDAFPAGRGGVYDLVYTASGRADAAGRLQAIEALGRSDDPRAVRPLADLLGDEDPAVRLAAAAALGQLKSGRPVDDLVGRLRDRGEDPAIRRQVVTTLAAIRSTGALRGLREFAADPDEDLALRESAQSVLRETGIW